MSVSNHLIHWCVIEQRAQTGTDAHNNPTYGWTAGAAVPCRLVRRRERDVRGAGQGEAGQAQDKVLLPAGTAVDVGDRITVTLEDGQSAEARLTVTAVLARRARATHHISVLVEGIG